MSQPFAIALGSNLGGRAENLDRAVALLDALDDVEIRALSRVYESDPWGDTDQPAFLNAVVSGQTTRNAHELLAATQRIEARLGKKIERRWGPRLIDLDVLFCGEETIEEQGFSLPHPRICERPFVYLPLRDVEVPPLWGPLTQPVPEGKAIEAQTRALEPTGWWGARACARERTYEAPTEDDTARLGWVLGETVRPGDMFALAGPLGAGKTAMVRGMARGLGIEGAIPSPSYTLCREYSTGRLPFQHWDFYRLEDAGDLESTGFFERVTQKAVLAIEWAELFDDELPTERRTDIRIEREALCDTRRVAFAFGPGTLHLRVAMTARGAVCQ